MRRNRVADFPDRESGAGQGATLIHRVLVVAIAVVALVGAAASSAHAAFTPNGTEYHPLTFPVREPVHYYDDFGGVRQHPGNDLMGAKLDHELAAHNRWMAKLKRAFHAVERGQRRITRLEKQLSARAAD